MIPMRSEQEEETGVILATGRPRFVMRIPSAGRPSSSWRHCSRKSLTFNVFIPQVYRILYISIKSFKMCLLLAQCHQRVDFSRSPRWHVAGKDGEGY